MLLFLLVPTDHWRESFSKQRKEIEYVNFKNRTKIEENVLSFLEIRAKSDEVPLFSWKLMFYIIWNYRQLYFFYSLVKIFTEKSWLPVTFSNFSAKFATFVCFLYCSAFRIGCFHFGWNLTIPFLVDIEFCRIRDSFKATVMTQSGGEICIG